MAKKSQRRLVRYRKDQAGCIWGFISIFDFRHGRSTRRLLSGQRHSSRETSGAEYSNSMLQMLTSNEALQENDDGEQRDMIITDAGKTSVKELMEEEIFSERDEKRHGSKSDTEAKESDMKHRRRAKRNRKRTKRTSKSSGDLHFEPDAAENLAPESFDLEAVINELCQQRSTKCMKHDWSNEKLIEAIKVFLDRRLKDGNHPREDRKIDDSREFVKALQTSSSNNELILELLKDPNSLLVKKIGDLEDSQFEKGQNPDQLARYGELHNSKESKPSLPVSRKQHSFFRRRSKSQENITWAGNENSQGSNRIVILKPVPSVVKISGTERKLSSSLQTSQFSFAEIKRKLKNAMGKERNVPSDDKAYKFPNEHHKSGSTEKGIGGEKGGWNSPNRNHFFIERFARPAIGRKKKDKNIKQKNTGKSTVTEPVEFPEQRVSDIYVEAKKHLSEILSNGDGIEDFSSRQLPKTLGRLLSLPEFNFSPICSPRTDNEHKFVTAERIHVVNADKRQLTTENPDDNVKLSHVTSDVLDGLYHDTVEGNSSPTGPEKSSEGDVAIGQTVDSLLEERQVLGLTVEMCSSSVIRDDQNGYLVEASDEEEPSKCLELESCEHEELPSSPLTSPPSSSITKQFTEHDNSNERAERPSPVSVLEPLFTEEEDEIIPATVKYQSVEPSVQPLQINFEEHISSATCHNISARWGMENEESAFEYVEAVLLASDLNWKEFLSRWLSLDQILDPSLFDEVELFSNCSRHDQKVLFDCTNEILTEVCECYFGYSPWVSFVKHNIRLVPRGKDLIDEVWKGVEWHLLPLPSPRTLEQIMKKDMAKPGKWMDLRVNVEGLGTKIEEAIFEELLVDTILDSLNGVPEMDSSVPQTELIQIG